MSCVELGGVNARRLRTEKRGKVVALSPGRVPHTAVHNQQPGGRLVRKLLAVAILAASITACKKTDKGDLEVEKPVVGTVTDTLNVPSVDVTTDTAQVTVPKVEVKKDTANIKVPHVEVKK